MVQHRTTQETEQYRMSVDLRWRKFKVAIAAFWIVWCLVVVIIGILEFNR